MTAVLTLVRSAQDDDALREALISAPEKVAQDRHLPVLVVQAASLALQRDPAEHGVWY